MSHCKMEYKYKLRKRVKNAQRDAGKVKYLLNSGCLIALIDVYCRMNFRVPPTSNYVQMAAGITKASVEFSGILGHYQFDFDTAQCTGSFVAWDEYDYDYESERFQMEREFSR